MIIKNQHSGRPEPVDIGDILYSYFDQGGYGTQERQRTWSFKCRGLLSTTEKDYILGPGNTMYELGLDCFTTDDEARDVGYYNKTSKRNEKVKKYRLTILTDEERIRC